MKSLSTSLHGHRLQAGRSGPKTDRLAAEAGERNNRGAEQRERRRTVRLQEVPRRAIARVPLLTADCRRIGRLDPVFKFGLGLREAQIVQKSLVDFCVRYVPAPEFQEQHLRQVEIGLKRRLGDSATIRFERMERLPRTSAGKFRAVISEVRPEKG